MPQVQSRNQVKRNGQKNRTDINETLRKAKPRDDLGTAFAGDKNRGPAGKKSVEGNTTHQKSRRLRREEGKEPVR